MNQRRVSVSVLVELAVGVAILVLLGAIVFPRYAELSVRARRATLAAVQGSFQAGIELIHAKWLATGLSGAGTVGLEGASVSVNADGWPTLDPENPEQDTPRELYRLVMSSELPSDWSAEGTAADEAGTATYRLSGEGGGSFDYDAATGVVSGSGASAVPVD